MPELCSGELPLSPFLFSLRRRTGLPPHPLEPDGPNKQQLVAESWFDAGPLHVIVAWLG